MLNYSTDFEFVRIMIALSMLALGSLIDYRKREIHDYYWIVFAAVGISVTIFEENPVETLSQIGFALIIAPLALLIWRLGLFGGADAFALISLAVIAPMSTFSNSTVTPFTILSNAAILFVLPLLTNMVRNTIAILKKEDIFEGFHETKLKKIIAMILGYRAKNPKFGFPIEKKAGTSKKISLTFHHAENQEFATQPNTWITPGIPYILLITGGFILQILFGDVILRLFN